MPAKTEARSGGSEAAKTSRSVLMCSTKASLVATSETSTKSHGWVSPTLGAAWAAASTRSSASGSIGAPVNWPRTSRRRWIAS